MRNPPPYFAAVKEKHPRVDFLLCTDTAYNNYASKPPRRPLQEFEATDLQAERGPQASLLQAAEGEGDFEYESHLRPTADETAEAALPGEGDEDWEEAAVGVDDIAVDDAPPCPPAAFNGAAVVLPRRLAQQQQQQQQQGGLADPTSSDLDLENAYENKISYNIGVMFMYAPAAQTLERMVVGRVGGGGQRAARQLGGADAREAQRQGRRVAAVGVARRKGVLRLAGWDQEPINKRVIQKGMFVDSRTGCSCAPSATRRWASCRCCSSRPPRTSSTATGASSWSGAVLAARHLRARQELPRKQFIFREEHLWHDFPEYYDGGEKFLQFEPSWPPRLKQEGGYDLITAQTRQVELAARLSLLLNRTLVLPRLRCGERPMAYPCYAWYHRAMAYFGLNFQKVPMPEYCPLYYWFDLARAEAGPASASPTSHSTRCPARRARLRRHAARVQGRRGAQRRVRAPPPRRSRAAGAARARIDVSSLPTRRSCS